MNAFNPSTARAYLAAGAAFVLVGADVAILARSSEALAAEYITAEDPAGGGIADDGDVPASY